MAVLSRFAVATLAGQVVACQPTESYYYAPQSYQRDPAAVCVEGIEEIEEVLDEASFLVEGYFELSDFLEEMYAAVDRNRWNECVNLLRQARAIYDR